MFLKCLCFVFVNTSVMMYYDINPTIRHRYFLIGYIGTVKETHEVFDGGFDTSLTTYPNLFKTREWLEKRYNLIDIRILSISEYNADDRNIFWKLK